MTTLISYPMVTCPSSSGCRITSIAERENSGSSSRNNTREPFFLQLLRRTCGLDEMKDGFLPNSRDVLKRAPQRRIGPTRLSVSGFFCFGSQGMIPYESTLERDLLRRLAYSPRVLQIDSQPVRIDWQDGKDHRRRYTPDYLIYWKSMGELWRVRDLPWLVEVKPAIELRRHWRKWHPKFRAASRYAHEQGWRFRIMDESRIRDVMFRNAVLLEQCASVNYSVSLGELPPDFRAGSVRVASELAQRFPCGHSEHGLSALWQLVAQGHLDCDLTEPLGPNTELWIANAS